MREEYQQAKRDILGEAGTRGHDDDTDEDEAVAGLWLAGDVHAAAEHAWGTVMETLDASAAAESTSGTEVAAGARVDLCQPGHEEMFTGELCSQHVSV